MEDGQEGKRRKGTFCAQTFVQAVHQKSVLEKKGSLYRFRDVVK